MSRSGDCSPSLWCSCREHRLWNQRNQGSSPGSSSSRVGSQWAGCLPCLSLSVPICVMGRRHLLNSSHPHLLLSASTAGEMAPSSHRAISPKEEVTYLGQGSVRGHMRAQGWGHGMRRRTRGRWGCCLGGMGQRPVGNPARGEPQRGRCLGGDPGPTAPPDSWPLRGLGIPPPPHHHLHQY